MLDREVASRKDLLINPTLGYLIAIVALALVGVVIEEKSGLLDVGEIAPTFSGRLHDGRELRLSEFAGRSNVVLFFYPRDFTAGCTAQVCAFRDNFSLIRSLDAIVIGISADSEESHRLFINNHTLPFLLIADTNHAIARAYGILRLGGLLPPKRVTYLLDRKGVIRMISHREVLIEHHVREVIAALEELSTRQAD